MRSLGRSIKNFSNDDMTVYAAALSYQLFFSLFPFIIFLVALLGVLNLTSFFDWLINQSRTVLPGQASGLVQNIVSQIRGQAAGGALSLGAIVPSGRLLRRSGWPCTPSTSPTTSRTAPCGRSFRFRSSTRQCLLYS